MIFAAVPFALDALRHGVAAPAIRPAETVGQRDRIGLGNLAAVAGLLLLGRYAPNWIVAVAAGHSLTVRRRGRPPHAAGDAEESVIADIGLDRPERLAETGARLQAAEQNRVGPDREWIAAFLAVLFAIHVSRMGFDRSALGIFSPLVAVMGDIVVALALTYFVIVPFRLFLRRTTRAIERAGWERVRMHLNRPALPGGPGVESDGGSNRGCGSRFVALGALLADVGIRPRPPDRAAAHGGDCRLGADLGHELALRHGELGRRHVELVGSRENRHLARGHGPCGRPSGLTTLDGRGFTIAPAGLTGTEPFSFIVIGDTGEGDASQQVLKDSLLRAADMDDVRFVVVSSDVVYPTGAMKDYESRFWLPFKGVTKPAAIPAITTGTTRSKDSSPPSSIATPRDSP